MTAEMIWLPIGLVVVIAMVAVLYVRNRKQLHKDNTGKPGSPLGL